MPKGVLSLTHARRYEEILERMDVGYRYAQRLHEAGALADLCLGADSCDTESKVLDFT